MGRGGRAAGGSADGGEGPRRHVETSTQMAYSNSIGDTVQRLSV